MPPAFLAPVKKAAALVLMAQRLVAFSLISFLSNCAEGGEALIT
jgi:hypothetical protein